MIFVCEFHQITKEVVHSDGAMSPAGHVAHQLHTTGINTAFCYGCGVHAGAVGLGTSLQAGRSQVRFPIMALT